MTPTEAIYHHAHTLKRNTPVVVGVATFLAVVGAASSLGWVGRTYYAELENRIASQENGVIATNGRIDALVALESERYANIRESQQRIERALDALSARSRQ